MAKRAARRFPFPYRVVFDQVAAAPTAANPRLEVHERDQESGLVEAEGWFTVATWGEHVSLCVVPEDPTSTRVEIEVARKLPIDFGNRRAIIQKIFDTLDEALPGGEDVDPYSDVPPAALADEVPDPNARWQVDRLGIHELRYWDGRSWTEHVADRGIRSTDPL
ncbi:MAG: DUF2510 domain-containing protein [Acidimicrobiia bacterium]